MNCVHGSNRKSNKVKENNYVKDSGGLLITDNMIWGKEKKQEYSHGVLLLPLFVISTTR